MTRITAVRIVICCGLVAAGWVIGAQLGRATASSPGAQVISQENQISPATRRQELSGDPISADAFLSALELLPGDGMDPAQFARFWRLCNQLLGQEFPAALERLSALKGEWPARLLEVWAVRDPQAAREWFESRPSAEQVKLFPGWADTWAQMDAAGLRSWLGGLSEEERAELKEGGEWVSTLAAADPEATLQLAKLHPRLLAPHTVLRVWARRDPLAAAAASLELSAEQRSTAANSIMREWGAKDPESALAWIDQLSDPQLADIARSGFVLSQARKDPAAALDWVRTRFPADRQEGEWRYVAAFASEKDPQRVATLAQQQTDLKLRRTLMAEAIRFMTTGEAGVEGGLWPPAETETRTDARMAADLWLTESQLGQSALPHLGEVATALASQHGIDATLAFLDRIPAHLNADTKDIPEWLGRKEGWQEVAAATMRMPPGERRSAWLEKAVAGLVHEGNIRAAQAVVDRLPGGSERNDAVRMLAGATFGEDPEASALLLLKLPEGETHLTAELGRWLKRDSSEARRWITRTDKLSAEQKEQLLLARQAGDLPMPR